MRHRHSVVAVVLCSLFASSLPWRAGAAQPTGKDDAAPDWAAWRGPNRDSVSQETRWDPARLSTNPIVLWRTNVGKGWSAVAIKGDRLYTMGNHSNQDSVVCLKASNGAEIWRHSYACQEGKDGYPGPRATPTVDDFGVYTLSRDGQVFCLDPASGAIQWQANLPRDYPARTPQWGFASSALLTGDLVLWNAGAHGIALNRRTGEKVWASPPGVGNYAVPVLYQMQGRQCAAIFGQQELVGVEVASGRRLWSLPWKRDYDIMAAEPIIRGDHLFVTSGYKRGCGLYRLGDGEPQPVWTNKTLSCHMATPVLLNGHLYGPDGNTRAKVDLKCVDFLTGEVKWARENMNHFQIMAAGDKLILLIENGELVIAAAQPDGYKELARARVLTDSNLCWTMPVLCGGRIYCRSPKGELAAVDVSRP